MNSNGIVQFDKIEIKNISIGKKFEEGQPEFQTKDLSVMQDLFVNRNANIFNNLVIGQTAGDGNGTGAVNIKGSLSVSGNTFLGETVQTTTIKNNIFVEDKLSIAGSVSLSSFEGENISKNFIEFKLTGHDLYDTQPQQINPNSSLGHLLFKGSNNENWEDYADIEVKAVNTSVENGISHKSSVVQFNVLSGTSPTESSSMHNLFSIGNENLSDGKNAEIVVNEDGINANFRVESSSSSSLLFTDGINNKVGVNTNTPDKTLDIVGDLGISGNMFINDTEITGVKVNRNLSNSINNLFLTHTLSINSDDKTGVKLVPSTNNGAYLSWNKNDTSTFNLGYNASNDNDLFNWKSNSFNVATKVNDENNTILSIPFESGNIGISNSNPKVSLDIGSSDAIQLPVGDSSTRPSGANVSVGQIRYNSQLGIFEGYRESDGNPEWEGLGNTAAPGQL